MSENGKPRRIRGGREALTTAEAGLSLRNPLLERSSRRDDGRRTSFQRKPRPGATQAGACFAHLVGAAAALGLLAGCAATPTPAPSPTPAPRVAISTWLEPKVRPWLEGYVSERGPLPFDADFMTTADALAQAKDGSVVFAILAAGPPSGWFATPLGSERLVVVVNPRNPVRALRRNEIADLFAGLVPSWSTVGGASQAVQAYIPLPGEDLRDIFNSLILAGGSPAPGSRLVLNAQAAADAVRSDLGGIAYLPASQSVDGLRVISIDGMDPQEADYPLVGTIVATAPREPIDAASDVIRWLQAGPPSP